jgi:hypothetical protein
MNQHFLIGFLKRAQAHGIDEASAFHLHEKYAGPAEDFEAMSSPGLSVTTPAVNPGTVGGGTAGLTAAPKPTALSRSPKPLTTGTVKATPGLRSGTEGFSAGIDNLKNFLGFGK